MARRNRRVGVGGPVWSVPAEPSLRARKGGREDLIRFGTLRQRRVCAIAAIAAINTGFHYTTDVEAGYLHELMQSLYYLLIILAGMWFCTRGGLITASAISLAYFPHGLFQGWHGPHSLFFRLLEILMFHVMGGVTGYLASLRQAALDAERQARMDAEKAYEHLKRKTMEVLELDQQLRHSERLSTLGQLTAGMLHEIRNPLQSILTTAEVLWAKSAPPSSDPAQHAAPESESQKLLRMLRNELVRLKDIVGDFLEFSRQDKPQAQTQAPGCHIEQAFHHTAELLSFEARRRHVRMEFHCDTPDLQAPIPEAHLKQVFLNLLLNALEAIDGAASSARAGGGWVTVRAALVNCAVRIEVEDSGPGIAPDQADKVFASFYTTKAEGSGLGLSVVSRIVSSYEGSIELACDTKPTSKFILTFPLAVPSTPPSSLPAQAGRDLAVSAER